MKKIIVLLLLIVSYITSYTQTANYIYDNLQRLTEIQYINGSTVKYMYDANGNRTQHIVTSNIQLPDLQIQNATTTSTSVSAGNALNVSYVNYNAGLGTAAGHKIIYFLSANNVYDATDIPLDSTYINTLAAASGTNLNNVPITIPATTTASSYFIIIYTDARNTVTEAIETNNTQALPITVIACASITLTNTVAQPMCGQANGVITLTATGTVAPNQYSINNGVSYQSSNAFNGLSAATYNCKVKDAIGCEKTLVVNLTSQNGIIPTANFSTTTNGLSLSVANTSTNATSYNWNFGDGTNGTSNNPSHTYTNAGTYNVCLTATNSCGSDVKCNNVVVNDVVPNTTTATTFVKNYNGTDSALYNRRIPIVLYYSKIDNSIYALYNTYNSVSNVNKCLFTKLNKNGTPIWAKLIEGETPTQQIFAQGMNEQADGFSFVLRGFSATLNYSGRRILKINRMGDLFSSKELQYSELGNNFPSTFKINHGALTANNELINIKQSAPYFGKPVFSKLDNNNNITSEYYFEMPTVSASGSIDIIGTVKDAGNNFVLIKVVDAGTNYFVVVCYDNSNNILWGKQILNNTPLNNGANTPLIELLTNGNIGVQIGDKKLVQLSTAGTLIRTTSCEGLVGSTSNNHFIMKAFTGTQLESFYSPIINVFNNSYASRVKLSYSNGGAAQVNNAATIVDDTLVLSTYMKYGTFNGLIQRDFKLSSYNCPDSTVLNFSNGLDLSSTISLIPYTVNIVPTTNNTLVDKPYSISNFDFNERIECPVNPPPPICNVNASFTQSAPAVCVGQSINFANTSTGNTATKWLVNNLQQSTTTNFSYAFTTAGNYRIDLRVSSSNTCADTTTTFVTIEAALAVNITKTNTLCTANNGTATVNVQGGNSPYQYSINNGVTFINSNQFTNLSAGIYTILVKDNLGCTANGSFEISVDNSTLQLLVDSVSIKCNGASTGSLNVTPIGGSPNYIYNWNTGATTSIISNLIAGNYIVNVIDSKGCTIQKTYTLTQPTPINISTTITTATCLPNGAINAVVTGGTPAYTYTWSNGNSTASVSNLASGNYSLNVLDANNCTKQITVVVPQDIRLKSNGNVVGAINVLYTALVPEFCDKDSLKLTVPLYNDLTYQWFKNGVVINGATNNNYFAATGGAYYCKLKDVNTCTDNSNLINVIKNALPDTTLTIVGGTLLCGNQTTTISAVPGYAMYTWNNGITTSSNIIANTGNYFVDIKTNKGCILRSNIVAVNKFALPIVSIIPSGISQLCNGDSVVLSTNTGFVNYMWNTVPIQATPTLKVKSSGIFNVKITDANGCVNISANKQIVVNPVPPKPIINAVLPDSLIADRQGFAIKWKRWVITTSANGVETYSPNFPTPASTYATNNGIKVPLQKAYYTLSYINTFGCETVSDTFKYVPIVNPIMNVSPNPTTSFVRVFVQGLENNKDYYLQLIDGIGQVLTNEKIKANFNEIKTTFDLKKYASSTYIIILRDYNNKPIVSAKVIKN